MTIEVGKEHSPQIGKKHSIFPIGRNRLLAISLAGLLTASCESSFLATPILPTPVPTLTPDRVASYCDDSGKDFRYNPNPSLSYQQYNDLLDIIYDLEKPSFPTNPQAIGMTLDWMNPLVSVDGSKVLYASLSGSINIVDRDGSNPHNITTPAQGFRDEGARWTPDGKRIIFKRRDLANESMELHIVNSDGAQNTQVTTTTPYVEDVQPLFLKDGRILFLRKDSTQTDDSGFYADEELYLVNQDGSNLHQVKLNDFPTHTIEWVFKSNPDHSKVAISFRNKATRFIPIRGGYIGDEQRGPENQPVAIFDSQTDKVQEVDTAEPFYGLEWTQDGEYLRYTQYDQNGKQHHFLTKIDRTAKYECPLHSKPTSGS